MRDFAKCVDPKDTTGAVRKGLLYAPFDLLVEAFGLPNDTAAEGPWKSADGKVRAEWAFVLDSGSAPADRTMVTVYDYAESIPLPAVMEWHIGGKNISSRDATTFIRQLIEMTTGRQVNVAAELTERVASSRHRRGASREAH